MPNSLSLFSALAIKKALDEVILGAFEKESGITIEGVYDPTTVLLKRIDEGARPDVVVAVRSAISQLGESGIVAPDTVVEVAKVGVGLATAPHLDSPDISTVDALKSALTSARSVAYSRSGASGIYFAELIERLGIADQVNANATVVPKGFTALAVMDGRADLAVQQLSELRFVPEAKIVGPFPADAQHFTEFTAGLGVAATQRPEAAAFLRALTDSTARDAYRDAGLEPASSLS